MNVQVFPAMSARSRRIGWAIYAACGLLFGTYLGINAYIGMAGDMEIAPWKPLVWELSSVVLVFGLVPLIVLFERRVALNARPHWLTFLKHLAAALIFSGVHVTGMLLLRHLAYAVAGEHYDNGDLPLRYFYELQKDLIPSLIVLLIIFASREFQIR